MTTSIGTDHRLLDGSLDAGDALAGDVAACLDEVLDDRAAVLRVVGVDAEHLVDAARELLAGGKRLRASFCYWGFRGTGADHSEVAVRAAAALELFHAAALVHDDVMDRSDTRRGRPSAHRRFATEHESAGFDGDAGRYGDGAALMLGDLLLGWSDELLSTCGADVDALARGRSVFRTMRTQVMGGQYLDILEQARPFVRLEGAERVLIYKSAKYSVEQPLLIGGTLGGAPDALLDGYSALGMRVGEAFQLRDDLLGVFGDPSSTGKPVGDDVREGKKTWLVAVARERADAHDRGALDSVLGRPDLDEAGLETFRRIVLDTGAVAAVESRIDALTAEAEEVLGGLDLPDATRTRLTDLVVRAAHRAT